MRALGCALHLGLDLIPQFIPRHHGSLVSLGNILDRFGAVQEWFALSDEMCEDSVHGGSLLDVGLIHQSIIIVKKQSLVRGGTPKGPIGGIALLPPVLEGAVVHPTSLRSVGICLPDVINVGKRLLTGLGEEETSIYGRY